MNNTCMHNLKDNTRDPNFSPTEIYFSDSLSVSNTYIINNLGVTGLGNVMGGAGVNPPNAPNNKWVTNNNDNGSSIFVDPGNADFEIKDGTNGIINAGKSIADGAPADSIGFDPKCIKRETGQRFWWEHAPDYDYIASVGGVQGCYKDKQRTDTPDMGAYEK